jgi:hypothetical protein
MVSSTDQSFGYNTLKLRATFVPDGGTVSQLALVAAVGHNQVRIPAMFVPDGGTLPGYPYEHIGRAEFHPDADGTTSRPATAQGDAVPHGHDAEIDGSSNMSADSATMRTLGLMAQGTEQMRSPTQEVAPGGPTSPGSNAHRSSQEPEGQEAFPGNVTVVLPDGQTVPDPFTGSQLKSPVADLAPVAVAGRQVGNAFRAML